jgi:hypothetical protein
LAQRTQGAVDDLTVIERLRAGEPLFGERLFVIGSGAVPIPGASGGTLTLDNKGRANLIVSVAQWLAEIPAAIADQLDRLAYLSPDDLAKLGDSDDIAQPRRLFESYTAYFSHWEEGAKGSLNNAQMVVVLAPDAPSLNIWRALRRELGSSLKAVYLCQGSSLELVDEPVEVRDDPLDAGSTTERVAAMKSSAAGWPPMAWLGIGAAMVALAFLAYTLTNRPGPAISGPAEQTLNGHPAGGLSDNGENGLPALLNVAAGATQNVASPVGNTATDSQWIAQKRAALLPNGRVVLGYSQAGRLMLTQSSAGGSGGWSKPQPTGIRALSFSMVADAAGRVHLIYSDGVKVSYALLVPKGSGWKTQDGITLDGASKSPVVDISWDERSESAQLFWAKRTSSGEEPYWAAVETGGKKIHRVTSAKLSSPGALINVLGAISTNARSQIVATYRSGATDSGWRARFGTVARNGAVSWQSEAALPTKALIGACSVVLDSSGTAHLILRDSTSFALLYFTGTSKGWSQAETAVDAASTSQIDFPYLSLDPKTGTAYVFFQDTTSTAMALRDPKSGWRGPYQVAPTANPPQQQIYPTSLGVAPPRPVVFWTQPGVRASIQQVQLRPAGA